MTESHNDFSSVPNKSQLSMKADCENCFGLCCVVLPFSASSDFARDKDAGHACQNLQSDFRCGIHNRLRESGFRGCTVYDCFGAGQKVSQVTFEGRDWRRAPGIREQMFYVFPIMRQLHELIWYLSEALTLRQAYPIYDALSLALDKTERLTYLNPDSLLELNIPEHRAEVNKLLLQTSELVRDEARQRYKDSLKRKKNHGRGIDLIGANLKRADFRCANLRGAYLIAADLRGADLRAADLIGVDFRDADLRGADLTESIFLTQSQINSALGDADTKLPPSLTHPLHWFDPDKKK
ncbi:pentapeptide repeat-containing protein [Paenibacillus sp. UNC451MF]|uniref:pentapeptide repeat-containing protein n=1 Tax=Paenibacillus sp. UNC451MF TaxID=1449063 RepID=UPI00048B7FB0|nr:pentapeptide repeat-containing protein [Paenibacillus sp. UNC451MF]